MLPMEPTTPPFGLSRETTILRTADGKWFQDGEAIDNPKLAHAFDCWIELADDGRYCLKNDINWAYITLEGAPFFVRSAQVSGAQAELLLSNDKRVALDLTTLREGPDNALYCQAYPGMPARFDSHAAVQLGALLEEDGEGPFFRLGTQQVRPPRVQDPLAFGSDR
ncbi:MAG: hypothetical protein JWN04_5524 [Myxococcaceae bacterium]|nr:hypothetical protein [Myxococcaceae bacterium]